MNMRCPLRCWRPARRALAGCVIVTQDGIRTLIGTVPPSGHRVLRVPQSMLPGTSFRIIAERPLARAIVSQPITASTSDTIIDWELQSNSMWFPEGEGS
jgi:hypothetical protein